jgi:hypothetical protein
MLVSGARVKLYINNRFIGEVVDFSYSAVAQKRPIYGIDATEPFEFAPGITTVKGRITVLRPAGLGSLEGYGVVSDFEHAPLEKYVSIMLLDRQNQMPVFQSDRAVITGQNWSVRAKGLMTGSYEFEGFKWINEAGFMLNVEA